MSDPQVVRRPVTRVTGRFREVVEDALAVEAPLEIRVAGRALTVTLRTPGHDADLALGFLVGEGVVGARADVATLSMTAASCVDQPDLMDVALAPGVPLDWTRFERHFAATSACGLCGRAHLESLRAGLEPMAAPGAGAAFELDALLELPARLRAHQPAFDATGGLHAAVLCGHDLEPRVVREDVGRHNAVDKIAGWLLDRPDARAEQSLLWVSGRSGAEIVLKAARARIPVLASVGAPSSLAVELAEVAGMTLIGFLRDGRANVYAGLERGRVV